MEEYMRYLVTGGAGFIGSNYTRGLLEGKWGHDVQSVTVLDALTYAGRTENLKSVIQDSRIDFVHGSINDAPLMKELVKSVDVIVHFAAESHVDRSINSASEFVVTNVLGTQTLLEAALYGEVKRFLHVSTDEVYGSISKGSTSESSLLRPNSPYASSKASSDLIVRSYVQTFGLDCVTTRCSNNYGPFQFPEKLLPRFITNLIDGKNVPVYGTGMNIRDWLHVDDHCRGIQLAIDIGKSGETYNIGGGTEATNLELTQMILDFFGVGTERIEFVKDRLGHDFRYSVDWMKISDELGYQPQVSLAKELPNLIQWYIEHEDWWRPLLTKTH
jgi:dTDP-glucose 4,6-dehydratase